MIQKIRRSAQTTAEEANASANALTGMLFFVDSDKEHQEMLVEELLRLFRLVGDFLLLREFARDFGVSLKSEAPKD